MHQNFRQQAPTPLSFAKGVTFCFLLLAINIVVWAQSGTTGRPSLLPNSKKYSDKGLKPATGRSGSATLSARALLGKDGKTVIEATTGELDTTTAPGTLKKVQIKPLNSDGNALYARNFNGLTAGGYFKTTVNDLSRHQQVQVQTNIAGIDANRTGVVTVVETTKLRPDLKAANLTAPHQANINTPVTISAVVSEVNGDVGARANFVLYVNGTAIDRSNGAWVDANGTANVTFSHIFTTTGTHNLEVKVEDVIPGDYDTANNVVAGTISIVQPQTATPFDYYAHAYQDRYEYNYDYDYKYFYNGVLNSENVYQYGHRQNYEYAYYNANVTGKNLTFPVSISASETNDGTTVLSSTVTNLPVQYSYSYDYGWAVYTYEQGWTQDAAGRWFSVTNYKYVYPNGQEDKGSTMNVYRWGQDVAYFSNSFYRTFLSDGSVDQANSSTYTYTYSYQYGTSTNIQMGSTYGISFSLTDATGETFAAAPEMALTGNNDSYAYNDCWSGADGYGWSYTHCYRNTTNRNNKWGYASGTGLSSH